MPHPPTHTRATRASFTSTHQTTHTLRRKHTSAHLPLSLIGVPWRFLHFTADNGAGLPPVLSDAGRQYMEEDAYRWQTQQTACDVIALVPQLTKANIRPLQLPAYGHDDDREEAGASGEEDDDDEEKKIPPLAEFNPFSDTFAVALSPTAHRTSALDSINHPTNTDTIAVPVTELVAVVEAEEPGQGVSKKKRGMVAADLLSHFAQKEVVDEERERTRKRERSKWENNNTNSSNNNSAAHGSSGMEVSGGLASGVDGGGVMVGGLGLSDESNSARQARLAVDAEEEERRRRLSAAAEDEGLTAADMPDMSDFIKLYESEDEPSYPAIIWRQRERLTEAADVPFTVVNELQAIDRERLAGLTKRRGKSREREGTGSRGAAKRGHERKMTLRFNLGLGKDYEEDHDNDSTTANKQHTTHSTNQNRFPPLTTKSMGHTTRPVPTSAIKPTQAMYGRQWYLPVVQWSIAEEEKERLEAATVERQTTTIRGDGVDGLGGDAEADGYHGDGWRDKVLALKAELPQLYCSRAFKAFLLRERERDKDKESGRAGSSGASRSGGGRSRLPHYLEAVEALDEKKEEEEEKRAIQAAVLAITTPRITHSSNASTRTHSAASGTSAASGPLLPLSPTADDTTSASGIAGIVGEEEREGDLLEYMREVRMRELNLAGLRWIKEREKAMEERERRKKEREKRKARAGSTAVVVVAAAAAAGGSEEVGGGLDEEDEVDLDKLFDVPDYPCCLT